MTIAMPASSAVKIGAALAVVGSASAAQMLAPTNDINLPASETASEPLKWLGANSPWFAGENCLLFVDVLEPGIVFGEQHVNRKCRTQRLQHLFRGPRELLC